MSLSPVSIQTQSLALRALRALRLNGNRALVISPDFFVYCYIMFVCPPLFLPTYAKMSSLLVHLHGA